MSFLGFCLENKSDVTQLQPFRLYKYCITRKSNKCNTTKMHENKVPELLLQNSTEDKPMHKTDV